MTFAAGCALFGIVSSIIAMLAIQNLLGRISAYSRAADLCREKAQRHWAAWEREHDEQDAIMSLALMNLATKLLDESLQQTFVGRWQLRRMRREALHEQVSAILKTERP